jgi:lysophospholipase L1-like esterase
VNCETIRLLRSRVLLAAAALCHAVVIASVCCGQDQAVTMIPEDPGKIAGLELWVSAEDLTGGEGAAVTTWPDRTSHHWDLKAVGGKHTLALTVMNGKPGVHFDGSQNGKNDGPFGAMLTDAKFFDATWKGPMSVFVVAKQDINPGPEFHETAIWTVDSPGARDKLSGLIWGNREGFWMNVHWIKDLWNCQCGYPMVTNVYGVSNDGAVEQDWINGMEYSRPQVKGSAQSRGAFCLGNHILYHNGYAQFGGYTSEVLIFKRGLSRKECRAVNHYLLDKYGKTGKQIVLEGHSQFNTLAWQLDKRLPGWDINNVAIGGTGLHGWADQVKEKFEGALRPGVENIAIVAGGDNTVGTDDAQVERAGKNYKRWALTLREMGWKTIVSCTPPRSPDRAYPLYEDHRQKLNAWLRAHYKEFADGLYDIDAIKELSDPKNLKYYRPDGVHLTIDAYELTADEIAKVIKSVAGGAR